MAYSMAWGRIDGGDLVFAAWEEQSEMEIFDLEKLKREELETAFLTHVRWAQLPQPIREHRFHPKRRWRADFAWPDQMVMVECQGGTWVGGAHVRGVGYDNDVKKHNVAILLGWRVLWVTTSMLKNDPAGFMEQLGKLLGEKAYEN